MVRLGGEERLCPLCPRLRVSSWEVGAELALQWAACIRLQVHQQLRESSPKKTLGGHCCSEPGAEAAECGAGPPCGGRDLVSGLLLRALWAFPGGYIQAEGGG